MAYVKKNPDPVGKWVTTTRILESCAGCFEAGSRVKIIGTSGNRGYDVCDSEGNRMIECGFDFFDPSSIREKE